MARVKGNSITGDLQSKTSLVSMTESPIGTLFSLWHGSRHNDTVSASMAQLFYDRPGLAEEDSFWKKHAEYICSCYPEHAGEDGKVVARVIENVAKMNLLANVPSSESVLFTFCIDDASVAFREQLVRPKSDTQWTQTSRTADLTTMDVMMSDSIEFYGGEEAVDVYKETVDVIRQAYVKLAELGVPTESIRLAPEARTHRVYWMINARALRGVLAKRLDWIAQIELWGPVIGDVCEILREKLPIMLDFVGHPDVKIKDKKVIWHKYQNEVEDRYFGRDPQPCDPLWLAYNNVTMPENTDIDFYDNMKKMFIKFWSDEILEVLGWDRKDPDVLGKYDRPYSYWESIGRLDMIEGLDTEYIAGATKED